MLQRRSANRISGWLSYTLGFARQRDGIEQTRFWSNEDQRHPANVYLNYRWTPSLSLSGRWVYGSGQPLAGFLRRGGTDRYFFSDLRNELRLPAYKRLDVRVNKSFTYDRWKLTFSGEVVNALNRENLRLTSFDGVNTRTGEAFLTLERVFPIVPVGGITFEF